MSVAGLNSGVATGGGSTLAESVGSRSGIGAGEDGGDGDESDKLLSEGSEALTRRALSFMLYRVAVT